MKFLNIFSYLVNIIVWCLMIVTVIPTLGVLLIWKLFVILVAKLFFKNLYPTDPNDTYFAIDDTLKDIHFVNAAQIWKIKGRVDVNEFRKHFYKCFFSDEDCRRRYRNLYCYLVKFGGYIFKKKVDEIDLDKHILEEYLKPGTELESFIAEWFLEKRFRDEAPLWEAMLLNVPLTSSPQEYETIFLYKSHHCLKDGYGYVHIVDRLTGNTSPYLVKEERDSFCQKFKDGFLFPSTLLSYVLKVARTKDIFYPIKNRNSKWFISFSTPDLQALKAIRRQTKTHFITVMMSLMVGALRRLISERMSKDEIPSQIWTANSLPWPNHPRNTFVNHWSGGVFSVPFKTEDSLDRLRKSEQFFKEFHDLRIHKMVKRLIIPATWCIPSFLMRFGRSLDLYYFRYSNAFASLMLSDKPHFLLGQEIENIYLPLGLRDGVPTSVMFGVSTSHSNQIDLCVVANSEIVNSQQDIDRLTKIYFPLELEELQKRLKQSNKNDDFVLQIQS